MIFMGGILQGSDFSKKGITDELLQLFSNHTKINLILN